MRSFNWGSWFGTSSNTRNVKAAEVKVEQKHSTPASGLSFLPEVILHRDGIDVGYWSLRLSNFNVRKPFDNARNLLNAVSTAFLPPPMASKHGFFRTEEKKALPAETKTATMLTHSSFITFFRTACALFLASTASAARDDGIFFLINGDVAQYYRASRTDASSSVLSSGACNTTLTSVGTTTYDFSLDGICPISPKNPASAVIFSTVGATLPVITQGLQCVIDAIKNKCDEPNGGIVVTVMVGIGAGLILLGGGIAVLYCTGRSVAYVIEKIDHALFPPPYMGTKQERMEAIQETAGGAVGERSLISYISDYDLFEKKEEKKEEKKIEPEEDELAEIKLEINLDRLTEGSDGRVAEKGSEIKTPLLRRS